MDKDLIEGIFFIYSCKIDQYIKRLKVSPVLFRDVFIKYNASIYIGEI